ncbi:hypothetical protein [Streptomyces sp. NPDC001404]|uniref:hypothetical protein n=1 Tax=Streptomyces sp. NPDC001404 TaxID=3364571 RepID=UPI0036AB0ECA
MEGRSAGPADFAWWQVYQALPDWLPSIVVGIFAGALELAVTWAITQISVAFPTNLDKYYGPMHAWTAASSGGLLAGLSGGLAGRIPGGLIGASIGAAGMVIDHGALDGDMADGWSWRVLTAGLIYGFVGGLMGHLTSELKIRRINDGRKAGRWQARWSWRTATLGAALGAGYGYVGWMEYSPSVLWMLIIITSLASVFGFIGGLAGGQGEPNGIAPAADMHWAWDWGGLLIGLGGGLAVTIRSWIASLYFHGFSGGLASSLTMSGHPFFGSTHALGALSVYGLAGGISYGIKGAAVDLTRAPGPGELYARDRRTFCKLVWVTSLLVGMALTIALWGASLPELMPSPAREVLWRDVALIMPGTKLARALVLDSALAG